MPIRTVSPARRLGQLCTGLGALVVLVGVLVGGPFALVAVAGNPLPDHLPTLAEMTTVLTSRDDGQLFLRALALLGWAGWATFTLSVLVELPARALHRPAVRLPGLRRQQQVAAALVGSVALILATSPAATAATAYAAPPVAAAGDLPGQAGAPPVRTDLPLTQAGVSPVRAGALPVTAVPAARAAAADLPAARAAADQADEPQVYRVAKGDHLGRVADRYLDDFDRYRELARLNKIHNPDQIHPGQLIRLPADAADHGLRRHATGRVVVPRATAPRTPPAATPPAANPAPPAVDAPTGPPPTLAIGASRASDLNRMNRPLAVSAVLAVASIVGAQIGAVLGLRRRPAPVRPGGQPVASSADAGGGDPPTGRHRRN